MPVKESEAKVSEIAVIIIPRDARKNEYKGKKCDFELLRMFDSMRDVRIKNLGAGWGGVRDCGISKPQNEMKIKIGFRE